MFPTVNPQPFNQLSTTQQLPLGTTFYDPKDQGRTAYRYVQFGGTSTINPGLLLVGPAAPSNSTGLALNSSNSSAQLASGATVGNLVLTNGATTVALNQFADGQLELIGTGAIEAYRILGNSADSVGNAALTISFAAPLRQSGSLVVGTNTANLRQSPSYLPVASTTQSLPVGVTIMPVPNTASVQYYGWVQIYGVTLVQATTATKGFPVVQDTSGTAGFIANTGSNLPQIGIAQASAVSNLAPVFLQIN